MINKSINSQRKLVLRTISILILLGIDLLVCFKVKAQTFTYVVNVKDSISNRGIPNVSYFVTSKNKLLVKGKSDTLGKIFLKLNNEPDLQIALSSIGYRTIFSPLNKSILDLIMNTSSIVLSEVRLIASNNLQFKPGKIILNISKQDITGANNALELLRNIPMISINTSDGSIYYKGKTGVTLLMDGQPLNNEILRSLKPNMVKQIQLLSSSSAKYSADNRNGILNIITVKKDTSGYVFSLDALLGTRNRSYLSPSIVLKKGKLNVLINSGYDYRSLISNQTNTIEYQFNGVKDKQIINNSQSYKSLYFNSSYTFNESHLLGLVINYYGYKFNKGISGDYQYIIRRDTNFKELYNNNDELRKSGLDATVDYRYKFPNKNNGEIVISSQLNKRYNIQDILISRPEFGKLLESYNKIVDKEYTFQLDYEKPLNENFLFQAGLKYILRKNNSNYSAVSPILLPFNTINFQNQMGRFSINQNIFGMFAQSSLELKSYSFGLGLRSEVYKYSYPEAENKSNISFFPNLSISKSFKDNYYLTFDYSRKIQRPSAGYLTNFINQSDLYMNTYGNSNLSFEFINSLSVGVNSPFKIFPLYFSLDYNLYNKAISEYSYYDLGVNNEESIYSTFVNLTHHSDFQISLNARLNGISGLKSNFNISLIRSFFKYNDISRVGNEISVSQSNVFSFKKGLAVNSSLTFKSKSISLMGYTPSFTITSLVFSKQLEKPNLLFAIGADNCFNIGQQVSSSIVGKNFNNINISDTFRDTYYLKISYELSNNSVKAIHKVKIVNNDLKN